MQHNQHARGTAARLKSHQQPNRTVNHWDRLPVHLQSHIRALASGMAARETYPKLVCHVQLAALRRQIKRGVRKGLACHRATMTQYGWEASVRRAQRSWASSQQLARLMAGWQKASAAVSRALDEEMQANTAAWEVYSQVVCMGAAAKGEADYVDVMRLWKLKVQHLQLLTRP